MEAQEMLTAMKVAQYPHMKEADQKKLHRQIHKLGYPDIHDGKTISTEELGRRLGVLLGGK